MYSSCRWLPIGIGSLLNLLAILAGCYIASAYAAEKRELVREGAWALFEMYDPFDEEVTGYEIESYGQPVGIFGFPSSPDVMVKFSTPDQVQSRIAADLQALLKTMNWQYPSECEENCRELEFRRLGLLMRTKVDDEPVQIFCSWSRACLQMSIGERFYTCQLSNRDGIEAVTDCIYDL